MKSDDLRPKRFSEITGNSTARRILAKNVTDGTFENIMLHGPHGGSKSTLADIYANALLCEGSDPPCLKCPSCMQLQAGEHACLFSISGGTGDPKTTAEEMAKQVNLSLDYGRKVVMLLDHAEEIHASEFVKLRSLIEAQQSKLCILIITEQNEDLPAWLGAMMRRLYVAPLNGPDSVELLELVCSVRDIAGEQAAFVFLADNCEGRPRKLIRSLLEVAEEGAVTFPRVTDYFRTPQTTAIGDYLKALVSGAAINKQLDGLSAWSATAEEKIVALRRAFEDLYVLYFLPTRSCTGLLLPTGLRDNIRRIAKSRSQAFGLTESDFWDGLIKIWAFSPLSSEQALAVKVIKTDLYLGPAGEPVVVPEARSSVGEAEPSHRQAKSEPTLDDPQTYLSAAQVRKIWDAASFMTQQYGDYFNILIEIHFDQLELKGINEAEFLSGLTHELGQKVRSVDGNAMHYLYVNMQVGGIGRVTRLVAHVPMGETILRRWIFHEFCPRRCAEPLNHHALSVRYRDCAQKHALRFHTLLLRYISGGCDPSAFTMVALGIGKAGRAPLTSCLRIPRCLQKPVGLLWAKRRYRPSDSIGPQRQKEAGALSAFGHLAWQSISSGWEMYEWRAREKADAALRKESEKLFERWPLDGGRAVETKRTRELRTLREGKDGQSQSRAQMWCDANFQVDRFLAAKTPRRR